MVTDIDRVSELIKQQNRARQRVHADADAKRRHLLTKSLYEMEKAESERGELASAREALRILSTHGAMTPAIAPVLSGMEKLLLDSSLAGSSSRVWLCPREALLNGGDDLLPVFMATLRALRIRPTSSIEGGEGVDVAFVVAQRSWIRPELAALSSICRRYGRRAMCAVAPTGRIEMRDHAFEEFRLEALARLRCTVFAWVFRLVG
mmetsp:Transcript_22167/g.67291  ORF Transcript_22167/g.67291 Transcript_22167/m.67291 type:complete len:206 (+) Transcript_22167:1-618(+)